jgi:hypothetical protein
VRELLVIGGVNVKDQISALNAGVSYMPFCCMMCIIFLILLEMRLNVIGQEWFHIT